MKNTVAICTTTVLVIFILAFTSPALGAEAVILIGQYSSQPASDIIEVVLVGVTLSPGLAGCEAAFGIGESFAHAVTKSQSAWVTSASGDDVEMFPLPPASPTYWVNGVVSRGDEVFSLMWLASNLDRSLLRRGLGCEGGR